MTIGRRPLSTVALGLAALAVFQLRDVLFFGRAFFERDLLYYYYPLVESVVREIARGVLPLRDPGTGFGQSILGNPQSQALYPPAWLHLVLEPHRAFALITLFNFVLGATGAAALARRFSTSNGTAAFAGALWMVSGPFVSGVNLWHHFAGTCWMPWVLVAFDRLLDEPRKARAAVAGALFGLQILAGSADLCAMTLLLAALLLVLRLRALNASVFRVALAGSGALIVGLLLGACVWLPTADLVRSSLRGGRCSRWPRCRRSSTA